MAREPRRDDAVIGRVRASSAVAALLVVATLALLLADRTVGRGSAGDMILRDSAGRRFPVAEETSGRVWVAAFVGAGAIDGCPRTFEALGRLHDELPPDVTLVTFVVGARGAWPPRPPAAAGRSRFTIVQGNDLDAAPDSELRRFAVERFGIEEVTLERILQRSPSALVAVVDAQGRPRRAVALQETDEAATRRRLARTGREARFVSDLPRRSFGPAVLFAISAIAVTVGLALARAGRRREHAAAMGLAALTALGAGAFTLILALSPGQASLAAAGIRGLVHGALLGACAVSGLLLAARALRQAARFQRGALDEHRRVGLELAPDWIVVAAAAACCQAALAAWVHAP